ncbi:MAG TPA: GNAT family N-acetyltransferase [Caulobacteraceae bacterium]|nr:GNAT family N-acetyltransferase [Caulobacteraceae bacterium]
MRLPRPWTSPKTPEAAVNIDIRPVSRAEAEAWRALRLEMLKRHPTAFMSSYEAWRDRDLDAFAAQIPDDGVDVLFGAFVGEVLCGSAAFAREARAKLAHKGWMEKVYVAPALRGRGVGEALVRTVIDQARRHVETLLCGVGSDNIAAGRLYRRMGFVAYGTEPRALRYAGRDYDEDLLVLTLY